MRTARDVLNELRWREGLDLAKAELWVRGRTDADVTMLRGDRIVDLDRRTFSTARATIPYYKIIRIAYEGQVVFERSP